MSKISLSNLVKFGKTIWEKHQDEIIEGVGQLLDSAQTKSKETNNLPQKTMVEELDSSNTSKIQASQSGKVDVTTKGGKLIVVDVKNYDDTYFEDMLEKLDAASKDGLESPEAATEALKVLAQCAVDTIKYCEDQQTKRVEILARRDETITKINNVTELIKVYLDKTFDERSMLFAKQFEVLDSALKSGNSDLLATTVNGINTLAAQSPFKALQDINQVQKQLDEGTEWDI